MNWLNLGSPPDGTVSEASRIELNQWLLELFGTEDRSPWPLAEGFGHFLVLRPKTVAMLIQSAPELVPDPVDDSVVCKK